MERSLGRLGEAFASRAQKNAVPPNAPAGKSPDASPNGSVRSAGKPVHPGPGRLSDSCAGKRRLARLSTDAAEHPLVRYEGAEARVVDRPSPLRLPKEGGHMTIFSRISRF